MHTLFLQALLMLAVVSPLSFQEKARTSVIKGAILDLESNDSLIQANILLETPDSQYVRGVASDLKGEFQLAGVLPGRYLLQVSLIGYQARTLGPFAVGPDSTVNIVVRLDPYYGYSAEDAQRDIQKGIVQIYLWSGFPMYGKERVALAQKYGFEIGTTGCNPLIRTERYDAVMIKYLEARNGEGWYERFRTEWDKIK